MALPLVSVFLLVEEVKSVLLAKFYLNLLDPTPYNSDISLNLCYSIFKIREVFHFLSSIKKSIEFVVFYKKYHSSIKKVIEFNTG